MKHLNESTLQAHLDGELPCDERLDVEAHLGACTECARKLREQESLARGVSAALGLLESGEELDRVRYETRHRWSARRSLARHRRLAAAAAVVLLVVGGAISAHPSSPVRAFVASILAGARGADPPAAAVQAANAPAAPYEEARQWPGVRAELHDGRLRVEVRPPGTGTTVHVRLVDGHRAALYAQGEARFWTAAGVLAAELGSGDVLIEIPRLATEAEISVGSVVVLRKHGDELRHGPGSEPIGEGEIRIDVPGGPS